LGAFPEVKQTGGDILKGRRFFCVERRMKKKLRMALSPLFIGGGDHAVVRGCYLK
jgi:hypothetical protein